MNTLLWRRPENCPCPSGVILHPLIAKKCLQKLQCAAPDALAGLSVVLCEDLLVLVGPEEKLPWTDGALYCAPHPEARDLWLPTHSHPEISADLLQSALHRYVPSAPFLLLNQPEQIIPLDQLIPLNPALVQKLLEKLSAICRS
ncbi:bpX5 domain-containing protein [Undibacterium squillarum]|uniref:bpX5 domain-containing protein n=1 Tax=Undibacterium squillarum TaxID=1131567 RepID=UPI0035B2DCB8